MADPFVLEALDRESCEALLANESVGRLAVVVDGQPHIVPVNYVAEGATMVFRTGSDTILTKASLGKVAFEVDAFHDRRHAGWSVCVYGCGRDITDCVDDESRHLRTLFVNCWAPAPRDHWFKVIPESVTGRNSRSVRGAWTQR